MKENANYAVPDIIKANEMLELVAQVGCINFDGICKALSHRPQSSISVTLNTLLQWQYLYCTPNKGYRISSKLLSLGNSALANLGLDIRDQAKPIMDSLVHEMKETSYLGVFDGKCSTYLAKIEAQENRWTSLYHAGVGVPYQITGIGKALLAWRDEKCIRETIEKNKPVDYTEWAILDPDDFIEHLTQVRQHGLAWNNCETNDNGVAVAAPIFSNKEAPIGGLSILTPLERMNSGFFAFAGERVYAAARKLSEQLGAKYYPEFSPITYEVRQ